MKRNVGYFKWYLICVFTLALILCSNTAFGTIIRVPDDYPTIQAGIDAAADYDTVLVADGTYKGTGNENVSFKGKPITVRSENGPDNCIIDCEGDGFGFIFNTGEDKYSILSGFTITNGYSAILISESWVGAVSPTIDNCIITANNDGGIQVSDHGAWGNSPTITNCIISGNTTISEGGGIRIECMDSHTTITNCIISGNTSYHGGGIWINWGNMTITSCIISGNTSYSDGAGIYCSGTGDTTITNCTIIDNIAGRDGGGVFCHRRSGYFNTTNCIFWGNLPDEIYVVDEALTVTYCDVQGGYPGEGNIDAAPLLVGGGDYHLTASSPCIDAGTNRAPELPLFDFEGDPRIFDGDNDGTATADMGADEYAYEYAPPTIITGLGSYPSDGGWIEVCGVDYSHDNWLRIGWGAYNSANGEARIATGDIDGDGQDEIVIGLGPVPGDPSLPGGWFQVLDNDYAHLGWGRINWGSYNSVNGESWPACGDVDGDGRDEIIIGLGAYPVDGGWFEIFDYTSPDVTHKAWRRVNWGGYNSQSGETRPACGDIDGDGRDEIVIGLGDGGEGWLEVFDDALAGYVHLAWPHVHWGGYCSGNGESWPACGDVDGDGKDEIIIGLGAYPADGGWFEIFDYTSRDVSHKAWRRVNWGGYNSQSGETRPACGDIDGDGRDEIVIGLGDGGGGYLEVFDDALAGYVHLGWPHVHWEGYCSGNGETWPAVKR